MKHLVAACATLLVTATAAHASITPTWISTTAIGGGLYDFTYYATLSADQSLAATDYFTIYDFVGFSGFGATPADWTPTSQLTGITPATTLPNDDAAVPNVSFIYTGATINAVADPVAINLGLFHVLSRYNKLNFDDFTSFAQRNNGERIGSDVATIGTDAVIVPGIPEPATWSIMIAGLAMTGAAMRRRTSAVVSC
jgi:hypothetical protein